MIEISEILTYMIVNWSQILIYTIDIALVAILFYQLYKLVRGTGAINILIGLSAIYLLWYTLDLSPLDFSSKILGQFINVGVIILAIVFQQELRKLLMTIGKGKIIKNKGLFKFNFRAEQNNHLNTKAIARACDNMAKTKTGAIMVITQADDLASFSDLGVKMNAKISTPIIESIFYKNSPLHDGAVIIKDNKIISARCVLPITNREDFPAHLGMRHRAAVAITEESDATAIIVSEETGDISYVKEGELFTKRTSSQLEQFLTRIFKQIDQPQ